MPQRIIGLVGGIASGKSTVAGLFLEERVGVRVDADRLAERIRRRPAVRAALAGRFPGAVDPDGTVNRKRLARLVFRDPAALAALEAVTHPPIRRALRAAVNRAPRDGLVIVDAALLQETGADALCDAVVYVACPARVRRARSARERGWTAAEHRARERNQWSCRRKRARADYVVDNGGDARRARRDVRRVLRRLEAKDVE